MITVATATTAELLAFFNSNSGKPPVKKFADRKTAERRVAALLASGKPVETNPEPAREESSNEEDMAAKTKKVAKAKVKKAGPPADRSKAVQATWSNKATAAARAVHNKVKVGGEVYRSVRAAFAALSLPDSRHIPFRMALKASETGRATFEHEGVKHQFALVKSDE